MTKPDPFAFIERESDPAKLRTLIENARRKGNLDIERRAFRSLFQLAGRDHTDPLEVDFAGVVSAYEELLVDKNGRRASATRARQKIAKAGPERSLIDWATSAAPSPAFSQLRDKGLVELTGEYLVVKYADRFSPEVVASAQKRLDAAS